MRIEGGRPIGPSPTAPGLGAAKGKGAEGFLDALVGALKELDKEVKKADLKALRFAVGEEVGIHEVAMQVLRAALAMEVASDLRDRLIRAVEEIYRAPI